jgi:SHS2 domain-containing protein
MSRGFRELESITADLGIEAWGHSLEEAFASAAQGLASLLSELPGGEQPLEKDIHLEADSLSTLLVQFLNEIIYLEETQDFLPGAVKHLTLTGNRLDATLTGAAYDPEIHTLNAQVKAATYHGLEIEKEGDTVRIKVIFDV